MANTKRGDGLPRIVEYSDHIAVQYNHSHSPENKQAHDLPFSLTNGQEITISLVMSPDYQVNELLLPKHLPPHDVENLAALDWRIVPRDRPETKLPPMVECWEPDPDLLVAACLPNNIASEARPIAAQLENVSPEILNCPYPDIHVAQAFQDSLRINVTPKGVAIPFYTYNEHCKYAEALQDNIPPKEQGLLYADYLRSLRTLVMCARKAGLEIQLKACLVEQGQRFIREKGLDATLPASWAMISDQYKNMASVLLEEFWEAEPSLFDGSQIRVTVSLLSHYPRPGGNGPIDCVACVLVDKRTEDIIGHFFLWPNLATLSGNDEVAKETLGILASRLAASRIEDVVVVENPILPFVPSGKRELQLPRMS